MLIVLALLLAVIGLVLWLRRRSSESGGRPGSPTFRILVLGPSGAGKTVFLASLYNQMKKARRRGYSFRLPNLEQKNLLNQAYSTIKDPDADWPDPTTFKQWNEFEFECVPTGSQDPAFKLRYADYSGEALESAGADGAQHRRKIAELATSAHAIFGMIDGRQVVNLVTGTKAGRQYFRQRLQTMVDLMVEASCPVHLIITKWDLVTGIGEPDQSSDSVRMAIVREALFADTELSRLLHVDGEERTIRLIPVSAVGPGFATVAGNGRVVKRGTGSPKPLNLNVPMAAVVPDFFAQIERTLEARGKRAARTAGHAALLASLGLLTVAARMVTFNFGFVAVMAAPGMVNTFGSWASGRVTTAEDGLPPQQAVLADFERAVKALERKLPNSVLYTTVDHDD